MLNNDAGWYWFQDEHALIVDGRLVFGHVARTTPTPRARAIAATSVRPGPTGPSSAWASTPPPSRRTPLQRPRRAAFIVRGDARILAASAGHGFDDYFLPRHPAARRPDHLGRQRVFVPARRRRSPTRTLRLSAEGRRIYDFFHRLDDRFKPSMAWSDDGGERFTAAAAAMERVHGLSGAGPTSSTPGTDTAPSRCWPTPRHHAFSTAQHLPPLLPNEKLHRQRQDVNPHARRGPAPIRWRARTSSRATRERGLSRPRSRVRQHPQPFVASHSQRLSRPSPAGRNRRPPLFDRALDGAPPRRPRDRLHRHAALC